eukprot:1212102-Prymnesium_polylepis.1
MYESVAAALAGSEVRARTEPDTPHAWSAGSVEMAAEGAQLWLKKESRFTYSRAAARPMPAACSASHSMRPASVDLIASSFVLRRSSSAALASSECCRLMMMRAASSMRELTVPASSSLLPLRSESLAHSMVCRRSAPLRRQLAQIATRQHVSQQQLSPGTSTAVQKPQRVDRRWGSNATASDSALPRSSPAGVAAHVTHPRPASTVCESASRPADASDTHSSASFLSSMLQARIQPEEEEEEEEEPGVGLSVRTEFFFFFFIARILGNHVHSCTSARKSAFAVRESSAATRMGRRCAGGCAMRRMRDHGDPVGGRHGRRVPPCPRPRLRMAGATVVELTQELE